MSRRGSLNGVHDRNETAIGATKERRAAMSEDMELAKAYRRYPEFCIQFTYKQFTGKVKAIAQAQGRPEREIANKFVDKWVADRARWQKHSRSEANKVKVRELPDGRKVFYGPSRTPR